MRSRFYLNVTIFVVVSMGLSGCSLNRSKAQLRLRLDGPIFPQGFKCAGVLVTGEAIPSLDKTETKADWESIYNGSSCSYPGLSTPAKDIANQKQIEFTLFVPQGRKTTVQVLGVETTGECPTQNLGELLSAKRDGTLPKEIKGVYELGRSTIERLKSAVIDIENSYNVATSKNVLDCVPPNPAVPGGNGLFPYSTLVMFTGDRYFFKPTGGVGPFTFTKLSGGGSFPSNSSEAQFVAPSNPDTVVIQISNATAQSNVSITVIPVPGLPKHWYTANYFSSNLDNASIVAPWANSGSFILSLLPAAPARGGTLNYRRNGAPKGFPSVVIPATGSFYASASAALSGTHSLMVVARRLQAFPVTVFCIGQSGCADSSLPFTKLSFPLANYAGQFFVSGGGGNGTNSVNTSGTSSEGWALFEAHYSDGSMNSIDLTFDGALNAQIPHLILGFTPSIPQVIIGGVQVGAEANIEVAEVMAIEGPTNTYAIGAALRAKYGLR